MITKSEFAELTTGVLGYLGQDEGYLLYELACKSTRPYVLEIGALQGFSTIYLAKSGKQVISVDLWDGADLSDGTRHIITDLSEYIKNMTARNLFNFIPLKMLSEQAAKIVTDAYDIGLIFIDGSHKYLDVVNDIMCWEHKFLPETWVLFHDYTQPCGVKQAVDEWVERNTDRIKERVSVLSIAGFLIK